MTSSQINYLRHAILLQLEAASPASLPTRTLHHGLRLDGHICSAHTLAVQLNYLLDKLYIGLESSPIATGIQRYNLTATGRDYLESTGLLS